LDLSAEAYLIADNTREEEWCGAIEDALAQTKSKYAKLISRQLVGMLIVVYVKKDALNEVQEVTTTSIGCGLMGMVGNKGAVGIRLRFRDSYLCFINSHLAADAIQVQRRKQDYVEIVRRALFPNLALPANAQRPSSYSTASLTSYLPGSTQKYLGVFDNDHLIWLGDLNYRVSLPHHDVKKQLKQGSMDTLLEHDQLLQQRRVKSVFEGFEEGTITFPPTYKFDVGTNNYDTSEKQRTPSWCDRILWRSRSGAAKYIKQQRYSSHPELLSSDHKPVSAEFDVQVKTIIPEKQADVHASIIRELDKYENECMPDVKVSRLLIDFGQVRYEQSVTETIVIENIGQVTAQCRFIPKLQESNICKPWLWVNPPTTMLVPGDKATISMTLLVDAVSAPALNAGEDMLEDILILHLDNGKDFFVSVSASYIPTCFATSLERLVRLTKPVRAVDVAEMQLLPEENQLSMPREIWRIVDYLQLHAEHVPHLFMQAGNPYIMAYIRDCLDTGVEFEFDKLISEDAWPQNELSQEQAIDAGLPTSTTTVQLDLAQSVHAMAETLLRFLEALPEPVIPFDHYQRCLDAATMGKDAVLQTLETLPRIHMNVFIYLTAFLR
ncbi:Endonuclease/exonuclease/phosphatase, partial [Thamnocephalis sphaerospora]